MEPSFCTYCGAPFREGDRFCGKCGQAIPTNTEASAPASAPAAPAEPPVPASAPVAPVEPPKPVARAKAAPQEPVLGIIPGVQRRHGFLGLQCDSYNVIIAPQRLIFAYVSKETQNAAIKQANTEAKSQGKGFFGVAAAQMRWLEIVCRQYQEVPVGAILQHFPGSFQIANAEIKRIRFSQSGDSEESGRVQEMMHIETTGGKNKYYLMATSRADAAKQLRQTLASVVK